MEGDRVSETTVEVDLTAVTHHGDAEPPDEPLLPAVFEVKDLSVFYGSFRAVRDVSLTVRKQEVTAFIGPSGCGKTTVLRCFNRMNDLIDGARVEGTLTYHGVDLYAPKVNA